MTDPIISLSEFAATATQRLADLRDSRQPIILTQNGTETAVIQDVASFRQMRQTLLMLKILAQGEADVRRGDLRDQAAVFAEVRHSLGERDG